MRSRIACIVALAACGDPRPAAPPPKPPALVTPATAFAGRVGIDGGSWTDFVIDGTDDAAHALCDQLVTGEQRGLSRVPVTGVYTRPCAVATLTPPPVSRPYVLVESTPVDQDSELFQQLVSGAREAPAPAHGTRTSHLPMADQAACDAMKARLEQQDELDRKGAAAATDDFLAHQIEETTQREQKDCAHVGGNQARCSDDRMTLDVLQQQRSKPPPTPTRTRRCELHPRQ